MPSASPGPPTTHTMASSPLTTPTTLSPSPSEEELGCALSAVQNEGHAAATQSEPAEVDVVTAEPASAVRASPVEVVAHKAPKGKAKAATGPLKLLDLPVDVLKEIIHQVGHSLHAPCQTVD
jgi:hypothetical protein